MGGEYGEYQSQQKVHTIYVSKRYTDVWAVAVRHSHVSGQSMSSLVGEALEQYLLPKLREAEEKTRELFAKAHIDDGGMDGEQ